MVNRAGEEIAAYIEARCREINAAARADERDELRLRLAAIVELGSKQICEALRRDPAPYNPINGG